jgi:DNA-binding NarL/FixJ family response regulator
MHIFLRKPNIRVAIIDDHTLFSEGLKKLLEQLSDVEVVFEAINGKDLQEKLKNSKNAIDIALMDTQMPIMDGYEATTWLQENFPTIKVIALSIKNDKQSIVKMIHHGASGYILKESTLREVHAAITTIFEKGFWSDISVDPNLFSNKQYEQPIQKKSTTSDKKFSPRELEFIQYAASDLAYKQIADKMGISFTTVENYRASCFEKVNIASRVGLVIYAIKNNIIQI